MIKYDRAKRKELKRFIGIGSFVLFFGILIVVAHSAGSQFSGGGNRSTTESSLDVQRIKREMRSMDREEIERAIKEIEKEIERLNSEI